MKQKKLLRAMGYIDDQYVAEADPRAMKKQPKWRKWTTIAACICLLVSALGLYLFLPYDTFPPDVSQYADSEYYHVIQGLNTLTYQKPTYKNNFQALLAGLSSLKGAVAEDTNLPATNGPAGEIPQEPGTNNSQTYEEVTDNQVDGVIEGDIFKRSDKYLYYMCVSNLYVYSIEQEDSKLLFSCSLDRSREEIGGWYFGQQFEFYLSSDCTTLTVIMPFVEDNKNHWERYLVDVVSLDVTDPTNIRETKRITVTGAYLSSRVVDGELLLMTNMQIRNPDFSDESTFLPQINTGDGFECISADNIMLPDTLTSTRYTTVFLLDEATLEVKSDAAFLSYSQEVYVSRDSIYATSQYTERTEQAYGYVKTDVKTEIARLSYADGTLTPMGKTTVRGSVKNQYSLDEYKGVLRVVTTTRTAQFKETVWSNGDVSATIIENEASGIGASLYCIDIDTWETLAEVKNFAPAGETVESVRFDGDKAYVCTAVVVTLSDPVFFFDLSDLSNITVKDTGVIDGYSSSLINFGNGYLLGVGFNDRRELKIEVYEESEAGVVSVAAYEKNAAFSTNYKSYFIDRENQLIGLGIYDYNQGYRYIVLHFDGFAFREVLNVPIGAHYLYCRAALIDGYLYIVGEDQFQVVNLWN